MAIKEKKKPAAKKPTKRVTEKKPVKKKPAVKKTTAKKLVRKKPNKKPTVKKKAVVKKPTVSKPVKKKPAVKKTTIKKVAKKKIYVREEVLISSILYNNIIDKKDTMSYDRPIVYLIGEDKKHVAQEMVEIQSGGGCGEMPTLNRESLLRAYFNLDKQNLVPCGLIRINRRFENDFAQWIDDSGDAIYKNIGTYMLSVDRGNITAEIFKPAKTHKLNFNEKGYTPKGRIAKLTVRLTDNE